MSGNGYEYYYPTNSQNFQVNPNQSWSNWSLEQQQYNESYNRNSAQYPNNAVNHAITHGNAHVTPRTQNFYNSNNRHYQQRRFPNSNPQFAGNSPQNWQQRSAYKRPRPPDLNSDAGEPKSKTAKKKKKPLSQNIPSKKDWTLEEAGRALAVEKEYNKRFKNHSLIIKFPDLELNRDIVTKFHPAIENVHFQQPSTPRFCFVTLEETADAEAVISVLNKIKFGEGHLTAEYKKDREEDQNIGPEDIDPCTLYVGNLAQEITKEDMVRTYPKGRRIDIGYAKKMKYTRYAFVSFKNVSDSIEAFKKTHSTQMYSKSLIVRFRRLHGTVGMPGESKPQSPAKNKADGATNDRVSEQALSEDGSNHDNSQAGTVSGENSLNSELDLSVVKQEVPSSDDESDLISSNYSSPFAPGSIDIAMAQHRPMIKTEIKQEVDTSDKTPLSNDAENDRVNHQPEVQSNGALPPVKSEPDSSAVKSENADSNSSEDDCDDALGDVNFGSLLNQLVDHSNQIESLRKSMP